MPGWAVWIVVGIAILIFRTVLEVIYRSRQPHSTLRTRWRNHAIMGLLGVALIVYGAVGVIHPGTTVRTLTLMDAHDRASLLQPASWASSRCRWKLRSNSDEPPNQDEPGDGPGWPLSRRGSATLSFG